MEQTVKAKCGHSVTVSLFGVPKSVAEQLQALAQMDCGGCRAESNPQPQGFIHMAAEPKKAPPKKKKDEEEDEPDLETEGQTGPPPGGDKDD